MTVFDKKIDYLPGSQVSVQAKISKNDIREMYDKMLVKYQGKLNIPGFRKGKAPLKVIEKRFSDALKGELTADILEEAVRGIIPELKRKPLHYARPEFDEAPHISLDEDFSFSMRLDVEPEFEVADYKKMASALYTVKVSEQDIDEEIQRIRERNALVTTKNAPVAEDDIVTVDYSELDENDKPVDGAKREGFVFTPGTDATYYDFNKEILGMNPAEEKVLEKEYPKDYRHEDLAGRKVKLKIRVKEIKQRTLPEADDELAQDVDEKYKTFADLKNDIKDKLEANASESARNYRINSLIKQIINATEIDIPESMVMMEADMRLRQTARQSGIDQETLIKMLGADAKGLIDQWRPDLIESIKTRLIINKLKEDLNITVEEQDREEAKKSLISYYRMEEEDLIKQLGSEMWQHYLEEESKERKLHQILLDSSKVEKEKTLSWSEFIAETTGESKNTKPKRKSGSKNKKEAEAEAR